MKITEFEKAAVVLDGTRRRVLEGLLARKQSKSRSLAEDLGISQQLVNHHLQKLMKAGYVAVAETAAAKTYTYVPVDTEFTFDLQIRPNPNRESYSPPPKYRGGRLVEA